MRRIIPHPMARPILGNGFARLLGMRVENAGPLPIKPVTGAMSAAGEGRGG